MIRLWLAIAGLGGISSVAVGALATHLAHDAKTAELLRIGALYGMVHAAALIFVTETASATCGERRVSRFSRTQVCSRNYGRLPARLFGVDIEAARA